MFNEFIEKEYLITNGIGGFSAASLTGANTRKYHSILNASMNPPVNRYVLLSKLETKLQIEGQTFTLESHEGKNIVIDQTAYLEKFSDLPVPTFDFDVQGIKIKKSIAMAFGFNTTAVHYTITTQDKPVSIQVYLHLNHRDHHDLSLPGDFQYVIDEEDDQLSLKGPEHTFYISGFGAYKPLNKWAPTQYFRRENMRGQTDLDSNFIAGYYEFIVTPNTRISFGLVASTQRIQESSEIILNKEILRRNHLTKNEDVTTQRLLIACDHFIVNRQSTQSKTIIAGYPWFTDWGRDTMIALPGLTLSTKRYEDAKNIIETFIKYEKDGLIPNMFPDDNIEPMYNTIDGTLWLFIAVYQYYLATHDKTFINHILPTLNKIIEKHIKGTTYNIHVDKDGLLSGGNPTTQLTWMDVKIDGVVVTPRHGKAVEINALWYNALNIMVYFSKELEYNPLMDYRHYADLCHKSFNEKFWNNNRNCLYDLIQENQPIDRIRPNQIFVVSLPFKLLDSEKEKAVIKIVEEKLLTPFGLRSLSPDHPDYIPYYGGDVYKRDYAYHQGTVWAWLMGPYLEAHYHVYKDKQYLKDHLIDLLNHLDTTCIGGISEVFSGDTPHHSRGCFSQAWSVSELFRIYNLTK